MKPYDSFKIEKNNKLSNEQKAVQLATLLKDNAFTQVWVNVFHIKECMANENPNVYTSMFDTLYKNASTKRMFSKEAYDDAKAVADDLSAQYLFSAGLLAECQTAFEAVLDLDEAQTAGFDVYELSSYNEIMRDQINLSFYNNDTLFAVAACVKGYQDFGKYNNYNFIDKGAQNKTWGLSYDTIYHSGQTEYSVDNPVFSDLGTAGTDFTQTNATRGDIPLATVTYDPASIFRFTGSTSGATMSTQGLNVVGNKMTTGDGTSFTITDIGGAIVALNNSTNYLGYKTNEYNKKYDLSYGEYPDESARWCMQPVQKSETAGYGEMELRVATHNGGDTYYYTTFCAPFDVLLTNAANDKAYVVSSDKWNTDILYPEAIGQHNTGGYTGNDQFIPAGTPVIIRTKSTTGYVTMALPTTTPSTPVSCAFSGKYLEQMLTHGSDYVYAFGRPYTGTFTEAGDFSTSGVITASAPTEGKGVGFYKNANFYREEHEFKPWNHNNKYVYANKIYYRDGSSGASSRPDTRGVDFIPVVFDIEGDKEMPGDEQQEEHTMVGDGRAYDLQGRCVATAGQVKDGTWRNGLKPGIYIVNGKKISIGRR